MDVSSVNSSPVSTVLESPQRPTQQVEPRNVQESRETQPQAHSRPQALTMGVWVLGLTCLYNLPFKLNC